MTLICIKRLPRIPGGCAQTGNNAACPVQRYRLVRRDPWRSRPARWVAVPLLLASFWASLLFAATNGPTPCLVPFCCPFHFSVFGQTNEQYRIDYSTNLVDWQVLQMMVEPPYPVMVYPQDFAGWNDP